MTSANKNAILQMEDRMERERKVWNEHKERSIAGERVKFEEEKTRLLQELQDQVKLEQERCQRLEKKLYDTQIVTEIRRFPIERFSFFLFLAIE